MARKGFHQSLLNVNEIIGPAVIKANNNIRDLLKVDEFLTNLDSAINKDKLGANAPPRRRSCSC